MIEITLKLHGNQGFAEAAGVQEIARTQALALSQLLKKLAKNKENKGKPWIVADQPVLKGRL